MKLKLCIIGYGRMGKMIHQFADHEGFEVVKIINNSDDWDGFSGDSCDVAIDFSLPQVAFDNIIKAIHLGIPVVSGTTGWLDKMHEVHELVSSKENAAFLYGSNFSLGVNLFFKLNQFAAKLMENQPYECSIEETHHTKKLDAPSGTAISLAEQIISINDQYEGWTQKKDSPKNIMIESIREPDIPGTHVVKYDSEIDSIVLEHKAKNREGFALGALKSARWLTSKRGYFTVMDFIDDKLKSNT